MKELYGPEIDSKLEELKAVNPFMAEMMTESVSRNIIGRPQLSLKYREIATLSVLISLSDEEQLKTHTHNALRVGISKEELLELINHMVLYVGFPKALFAQKIMLKEMNINQDRT
ncbi:MAG: carboxymuconolactone decarboxylase family protein [Oligoflexia bacterium]|nr:carboxymuconolactone decarboxylase family protein [Oligoflexia bacterium]MBF0367226.1 carboxymuconolactone decarboxylase family protein [Oligoflexia bacterium]